MRSGIALLRGINVSGQRLVRMEALRELCSELGLSEVRTYIQSGNILFNAKNLKGLEDKISEAIMQHFGFDVPVIVKSAEEWAAIIAGNPFKDELAKAPERCYVTLLSGKPVFSGLEKNMPDTGNDDFKVVGGTIYLYLPQTYGLTKLTNSFLETRLKCKATTRNWKTMLTLLEMSSQGKPSSQSKRKI